MSDPIQEQGVQKVPPYRYCLRCLRKLKIEKAMRQGYGKVIAMKVHQEALNGHG
jgi:hypothetical protein